MYQKMEQQNTKALQTECGNWQRYQKVYRETQRLVLFIRRRERELEGKLKLLGGIIKSSQIFPSCLKKRFPEELFSNSMLCIL